MAQLIDGINTAWSSFAGSDDASGWRTIPIGSIGACVARAGRRFPDKEEALLVGFSTSVPTSDALPESQGFSVARVTVGSDGKHWLALARTPHGSIELFATMVGDIVQALGAEDSADDQRMLRIFLGRLRAWQEFMRKGAQALSPEAELGLIGELLVLGEVLGCGVPPAIAVASWEGPKDGVQDFRLGAGAIEVKTTLASVGFPAKIGSLDQLDDSVWQPLFVAGVRLKLSETGRTLPDFAGEARARVSGDAEASRLLGELLLAAGCFLGHEDRYSRRFLLVGIRAVEVEPGFPRLTAGSVPPGISRAIYEIDLDKAPGKDIGVMRALQKIKAITS